MDDLISRQAAIDALGERPMVWIDDDQYTLGERNQYDLDKFSIETVPSAQPDLSEHSTWFRIGETLVEESKMHITAEQAINKIRGYMIRMKKPEPQWIPCDKGEPDEDMECWVTVKTTDTLYRGNFTKRYGEQRDKGFITSGGFMWWNTALAWMPIYEPKPYKERRAPSEKPNNGIGCSRCEGRLDCYDRDLPHAAYCNNYGKITDAER